MEKQYEETGINTSFIFKLASFLIIVIGILLFASSKYFDKVKVDILSENEAHAISMAAKENQLNTERELKNIDASIKIIAKDK